MSSSRLIRVKEVLHRTGLSRSSLYRRLKAGTFPEGVRLGVQSVAWKESDIEAWIG